jgi:hypothetical protein
MQEMRVFDMSEEMGICVAQEEWRSPKGHFWMGGVGRVREEAIAKLE